jgi:predicted nucleic acid-binding protein
MALSAASPADIPAGRRVYLDTNIWIYALEGFAPFATLLEGLFARIDRAELSALTSELTLAEALVKPFASGQIELQRLYLETLRTGKTLTVAPLSRDVLVDAARLRAQSATLKLADAIHAATALAHRADFFLTSDARLGSVAELDTIVLRAP